MKRDNLTIAEYKKLAAKPAKKNKYLNKRTFIKGMWFDSLKEARRYADLEIMQKALLISGLKRQVAFPLNVNGHHICRYVADFVYIEKGERIVEDCKSPITKKDPVYRLKKALMDATLGIEIKET